MPAVSHNLPVPLVETAAFGLGKMFRAKIDNPHFSYFLRGHPGIRLRDDVEKGLSVKIQVLNNTDEVVIEGEERTREKAFRELQQGWFDDDFAKARELMDLMEESAAQEFMSVSPKFVSSLIGHYGRRVAGLENRSNASIKIDCTGHIAIFGTAEACGRAKAEIDDWIRRESGDLNAGANGDPADDHLSPPTSVSSRSLIEPPIPGPGLFHRRCEESGGGGGPCLITFWVPARAAALIMGPGGQGVAELERDFRCLIDVRDEGREGMVPVDLTAKESRKALDAKEGILQFLSAFMPRDWPDRVRIRTIGNPHEVKSSSSIGSVKSSPTSCPATGVTSSHSINGGPPPIKGEYHRSLGSCGSAPSLLNSPGPFPPDFPLDAFPWPPPMFDASGGVIPPPPFARLTFTVAEEHAPRLIGTKGVNKRRLEERTNSCLVLRTEERQNGFFPVDVIARSREDCERARIRVCAFLNERPTTQLPPPTFSSLPLPGGHSLLHSLLGPPPPRPSFPPPLNLFSPPPVDETLIYEMLQSEPEEEGRVGGGFGFPGLLAGVPRSRSHRTASSEFFSDLDDASERLEDSPKSHPVGEEAEWDWVTKENEKRGSGFGLPPPTTKARDSTPSPMMIFNRGGESEEGEQSGVGLEFFDSPRPDYFADISDLRGLSDL